MKNILLMLLFSTAGRILLSLFFAFVFAVIFAITGQYWASIAMYISLIYPFGFAFLMIIYAWIINPIKQFGKNKKTKK